MPITPEKRAKWPWRIDTFDAGFPRRRVTGVCRYSIQPEYEDGLIPVADFVGDFDSLAAAIYAIAKTQEE